MDSQAVKLEVTEDYTIDEGGNAKIMIVYECLNESDVAIPNFSKKLVKEFDGTNIDISRGPLVAVVSGSLSVRNVSKREDRGRKIIEWVVERDALVKGDPCTSLLTAKWSGLASKLTSRLGTSYMVRISHLATDQIGYTLMVTIPKPSEMEKRLWKRLVSDFDFVSSPPPDELMDKQTLKWRRSALNDRLDVTLSYGFKFKVWLMTFLATAITTLFIQFLIRVILHW